MDPHHHHQWRHRPPISAALCPICSVPHFPFCPPPPPPFNQNLSFPQRSNFDPYLLPPPAAAPLPRNPNFVANFPPSLPPPPPPPYGNGYVSDGGDKSFKRPRIEDFGPGSGFANPNLREDERRLKLIHDHGGVNSGLGSDRVAKIEPVRYESSKLGGGVVNMHNNNNGVIQSKTSNEVLQGYGMPLPMPPHSAQFGASNGCYFHSRLISGQPPLPASPPPPLPVDPPPPLLFPLHGGSSSPTVTSAGHSMMQQPYLHSKPFSHASTGYVMEFPKEAHGFHQILPKPYVGEGQPFTRKHPSLDKPKVVDATRIFKKPHRGTRPDHFVIILRGLPGSGKSYLAKLLRDLEVETGGAAPRIHSMDDYFMTEVEKVEEGDASKSSSSRGKKPVMKKVMEYCYEPEMEEAYRSSMLKAFKKTVEDGDFTFVIVDDRNLRVAEFAQFWAIAKSSGYEVYILEAPYKDPAGCAARNVHGCTQDDIRKMAGQWEESPSIYLQMDAKSLFHGDDLKDSGIQEVDMDTEDADNDGTPGLQERESDKTIEPPAAEDGSSKDMKSLDAEEDYPREVKELGRSKWSEIADEDDTDKAKVVKGNALSGLIQAYNKEEKSVCWSDQVGNTGFSITAAKKANVSSLVIGPGAGYNLRSNPLPEEEIPVSSAKSKKQNAFQDQLRAEHQSFKAVFDRRRHRIGGLGLEDE